MALIEGKIKKTLASIEITVYIYKDIHALDNRNKYACCSHKVSLDLVETNWWNSLSYYILSYFVTIKSKADFKSILPQIIYIFISNPRN